jgi:hypothetical protein
MTDAHTQTEQKFSAMLQVLSLEYETLRTEKLALSEHRSQFLALLGTAAGVAVAVGDTSSVTLLGATLLAVAIAAVAFIVWFAAGVSMDIFSKRLSQIEKTLNDAFNAAYESEGGHLLRWETAQTEHHAWSNKFKLSRHLLLGEVKD